MDTSTYDDEIDARLREKRKRREYWQYVKYGLEPGQWDEMFAAQGGVCAICKKRRKRMDTDHCHTTGIVRGILCHKCNVMIGHANDDHERLYNASEYLKKFSKKSDSPEQKPENGVKLV